MKTILLLISLFLPVSALAAITCTADASPIASCGSTTNGICSATYTTNPTAGDTLFVATQINQVANVTMTSSQGDVFSQFQSSASPVNTTGPLKQALFRVPSAVGGATTITATWSVTGNTFIIIGKCTGVSSSPEDQGVSAVGTLTALSTGTTAATNCANEVDIAAFGTNGGAVVTPAGFTAFGTNAGGWMGFYFQVISSTGTQTASTTATSGNWIGQLDTFRASTCPLAHPGTTIFPNTTTFPKTTHL